MKQAARLQPGDNTIRFFFCLLTAVAMWLFLALNKEYNHHARVFFTLQIPDDRILSDSLPATMELKVRGTGWDLLRLSATHVQILFPAQLVNQNAVIDLQAQASEIARQLPEGIQVLQVYPGFIDVISVEKASRKVPLRLTASTGEGWRINQDSTVLQPDSVLITGPADYLSTVEFWESEHIQLADSSGFQHGTAALKAPGNMELSAIVVQYKLLIEANLVDSISSAD